MPVAWGGGVGSGAAVEEAWAEEAVGEGVVYGLAYVAEVEEVVEGAAAVGLGGHFWVGLFHCWCWGLWVLVFGLFFVVVWSLFLSPKLMYLMYVVHVMAQRGNRLWHPCADHQAAFFIAVDDNLLLFTTQRLYYAFHVVLREFSKCI